MVPLNIDKMRAELDCYFRWHNGHRPNTSLGGRTPDEVYFRRKPANEKPRYEPRAKYPRDAWCASPPRSARPFGQTKVKGRRGVRLKLEVRYFEGRRYLPLVEVRPAA